MTILITGAGLIGCRTASLLAARGERPVLLDLRPNEAAIASLVPDGKATIVAGDVSDRAAMRDLFKRHGVTQVVHTAAALSLAIRERPTLAFDVNLGGTVALLEAARATGVKRFLYASSTTVAYSTFGDPLTAPVKEDLAMRVASQAPRSFYAAAKLAGEWFVRLYGDQFELDWAALRYAAVLGLWAGPNNSVPGGLMAKLLGQGAIGGKVRIDDKLYLWTRGEDFVDARDVAAANVAALDAPALPSRVYNIASGRMTSVADFVAAARRVRPNLSIEAADVPPTGFAGFPWPRDYAFDISAAAKDFGYRPAHDVESSLRDALPVV